MTTNSLRYGELQESMRTNRANEELKDAANREIARHNRVTEGQTQQDLGIKGGSLSETTRSHLANESNQRLSSEYGLLGSRLAAGAAIEAAQLRGDAAKYGADTQAAANRYSSDVSRMGSLYNLAGVREGIESRERIADADRQSRETLDYLNRVQNERLTRYIQGQNTNRELLKGGVTLLNSALNKRR